MNSVGIHVGNRPGFQVILHPQGPTQAVGSAGACPYDAQ